MGDEYKPTSGTLLTTIPKMYPIYSVQLEIKVTGSQTNGWKSVVHITQGGSNSVPGDRMPLISLHPNELRLQISSYVNDKVNYAYKNL